MGSALARVDGVEPRRMSGSGVHRGGEVRLEEQREESSRLAGKDEDPGVPEVEAVGDERRGGSGSGFSGKRATRWRPWPARSPRPRPRPRGILAGLGPARGNSQRERPIALAAAATAARESARGSGRLLDPVIGMDETTTSRSFWQACCQAPADRRRGVAPHRLEHDLSAGTSGSCGGPPQPARSCRSRRLEGERSGGSRSRVSRSRVRSPWRGRAAWADASRKRPEPRAAAAPEVGGLLPRRQVAFSRPYEKARSRNDFATSTSNRRARSPRR